MKQRQIILIGGAPTTGKSTIAQKLSKELGLPYISTDQIRTVMQAVARKEDYPGLFNSHGYDAERFLTELNPEQIVHMEFEQGAETWLGVKALMSNCGYEWRHGFIIEGVGIVPETVHNDCKDDPNVTALFLVDHDDMRMRDALFTRGLWDAAHKYGDHLKEKEMVWARLYAKKLEEEAQKYGYPFIEVHKNDDDLQRVLDIIARRKT